MKKMLLAVLAVLLIAAVAAQAQVVYQEDFEGENPLSDWTIIAGAANWSISNTYNKVPGDGTNCLKSANSGDKIAHNFGFEISNYFKASWWIYDDTSATGSGRAYGEMRGYTGTGYASGTVQQVFACGKYNNTTIGGAHLPSKYQARVSSGDFAGWFNLDADGSPNRTAGWHNFTVERLNDGTVNFYIDNILGKSVTGATNVTMDCVAFGNGAGTTVANSWYDGVMVAVPEPGSFVALASGLVGMAGFAIRRRRS